MVNIGDNKIMNDEGLGQAMAMSTLNDKIKMMLPETKRVRNYSLRSSEWLDFSFTVFTHIETYCIPQYGDKGSDQCSEFSESDFITQMKKYLNRYGKNSRDDQQKLDLLKIAHYAGMLHAKLTKEELVKNSTKPEFVFNHSV